MTLTRQEARLVRELSYTPGRVVRWPILAVAIDAPVSEEGRRRVNSTIQRVREKFGRDAIRGAWGRGVYLPVDWERR